VFIFLEGDNPIPFSGSVSKIVPEFRLRIRLVELDFGSRAWQTASGRWKRLLAAGRLRSATLLEYAS
jgi:hypothetical protein